MTGLDFSTVTKPSSGSSDTPPSDPPNDSPRVDSDDLTCIVCNAPLTYGGRGPKPKYCDEHRKSGSRSGGTGTSGGASARDVERACESLSQLYDIAAMTLMLVSPEAGRKWSDNADKLDRTNRQTLANNKRLVARINKGAGAGGSAAFVITHVFAIAPVLGILRNDIASRRAENEDAGPIGSVHPINDPIDPDAAFRK